MKVLSKLNHLIWLVVLLAITTLASPVAASGFSRSLMLFAYDGQNQARVAYDEGFPPLFGYDTAVVSTAAEAHETARATGFLGKSAEFLAAEDTLQIGYHATAPANVDSILANGHELSNWVPEDGFNFPD